MRLTPPPKKDPSEYEPIPEGVWEVAVKEVEEVLQNEKFWKDPAIAQYQLQWELVVTDEGAEQGKTLRMWTGSSIGRHPRNKLVQLLKVLVPDFNLDDETTYFTDDDDFKRRVLYKPFRVVTKVTDTEKVVDGEKVVYHNAKVESFLKTAKANVGADEVQNILAQAGITSTEKPPF